MVKFTSILILIFILIKGHAFAGKAMIIVLEAPIFQAPDFKSKILQYHRKGHHIYIHGDDMGISPNDILSSALNHKEYQDYLIGKNFFKTLTRNGQRGYISKNHVKLIYADEREFLTDVTPFEYDPTDYRLAEPIPENYPHYNTDHYRIGFIAGPGQQSKVKYDYDEQVQLEAFSARLGAHAYYMKNVDWDTSNRLYFGARVHFFQSTARLDFANKNSSLETHYEVSAGPYLSYDIYRKRGLYLAMGGGIDFSFHRREIQKTGSYTERRVFSGKSLNPRVGTFAGFSGWLPGVDIIGGFDLDGHLPFTLKPTSASTTPSRWSQNDVISFPLEGSFNVFIGVQLTI